VLVGEIFAGNESFIWSEAGLYCKTCQICGWSGCIEEEGMQAILISGSSYALQPAMLQSAFCIDS
jgi:hypothetical protein